MKLLLDTHLLIWTAAFPSRLSRAAVQLIEDPGNDLLFSVASIWEIALKRSLVRLDQRLDPGLLRRMLLENSYQEVAICGSHAISAGLLPQFHKDPFDRMLVAQANVEGAVLLTSDTQLARYSGAVRSV